MAWCSQSYSFHNGLVYHEIIQCVTIVSYAGDLIMMRIKHQNPPLFLWSRHNRALTLAQDDFFNICNSTCIYLSLRVQIMIMIQYLSLSLWCQVHLRCTWTCICFYKSKANVYPHYLISNTCKYIIMWNLVVKLWYYVCGDKLMNQSLLFLLAVYNIVIGADILIC